MLEEIFNPTWYTESSKHLLNNAEKENVYQSESEHIENY